MTFNLSVDKIFDNLRKLSPIVLAMGIVTGAILFLPYEILEKIHMENIPENWLTCIGFIFLLSIFLTIIIVCQLVVSWAKKELTYVFKSHKLKQSFKSLSPTQKSIIQELLHSEDKLVILKMTDGNAAYLIKMGFIQMPKQPVILDRHDRNIIWCRYLAQPWLLTAYNRDPNYFFND